MRAVLRCKHGASCIAVFVESLSEFGDWLLPISPFFGLVGWSERRGEADEQSKIIL